MAASEAEQKQEASAKIRQTAAYQTLVRRRTRFGWILTAIMLVVYYGYIGLIAFDKPFLAQPIGSGVMSLGIPVGVGIILITIALTGIYVARANSEFDRLTREIVESAQS
jgi:uncharacterized membrane protein (DUF485 family)